MTLFKSVGTALADLAAASLAVAGAAPGRRVIRAQGLLAPGRAVEDAA